MTDFRKLAEKLADRLYDANVTLAYLNEKNLIDDEEPIMKTWEILADARNEIQEPKPDDTEKLNLLINKLKEFAEAKHCYDIEGDDYTPSASSYDNAFDDGIEYGEINFARTMLESLGVDFEYPCEKEND